MIYNTIARILFIERPDWVLRKNTIDLGRKRI